MGRITLVHCFCINSAYKWIHIHYPLVVCATCNKFFCLFLGSISNSKLRESLAISKFSVIPVLVRFPAGFWLNQIKTNLNANLSTKTNIICPISTTTFETKYNYFIRSVWYFPEKISSRQLENLEIIYCFLNYYMFIQGIWKKFKFWRNVFLLIFLNIISFLADSKF